VLNIKGRKDIRYNILTILSTSFYKKKADESPKQRLEAIDNSLCNKKMPQSLKYL